MSGTDWPRYLAAVRSGELHRRIERAREALRSCSLCPRGCKANRGDDETGVCETGREALVSSAFPHLGEENPIRGHNGSGTIFLSHCNLRCSFCQNYDISWKGNGRPVAPEELAQLMLGLQRRGCHNINFVTPTHAVAQILEALPHAIDLGLRLPIVYNTGGYDSPLALELMDGIVDIYMPDFKFWDPAVAKRLADAEDYPEVARNALREMHRQVGDLELDEDGIALRGLLVRHLVMPDGLAGTRAVARFLAQEISKDTYINIMGQYHSAGRVGWRGENLDLDRCITPAELEEAHRIAREEGLHRFDK